MTWMEEAAAKLKAGRQLLFSKDTAYLQDLRELLESQDHIVVTLWALDLAGESVAHLEETYPAERRPRAALEAARAWAAGNVKMRWAQRKILDCHVLAKELDRPEAIAACHGIGQACSVVHTAGHAIGYPMYDLTALIHRLGIDSCAEAVEDRKQDYIARLFYWSGHRSDAQGEWAPFMQK